MNYAYCHFRGPDGRVYGINEQGTTGATVPTDNEMQDRLSHTRPNALDHSTGAGLQDDEPATALA